jgi:hypothetical protein
MTVQPPGGTPAYRLPALACVALTSAAVITYEIVLMQRLLIERWHHFGYLVISVALLGFGASGTLLALLEKRLRARPLRYLRFFSAALAVSLLLVPHANSRLPLSVSILPADLARQVGLWLAYFALASVPFLLGGSFVGAALATAGPHVGLVYAANLFASGLGAATAILVATHTAPAHGFLPAFAPAWASTVLLTLVRSDAGSRDSGNRLGRLVAIAALIAAAVLACRPVRLSYDPCKAAARLGQLLRQNAARRVAQCADPHGYVELYEGSVFHELPLIASSVRPPEMYCLTVNGDAAASVLRIESPAQAEVMRRSLMALPYRLLPEQPRVLLLGELGGANAWLALCNAASCVDLVQPNAAVCRLLRRFSPALLADTAVRLQQANPRQFVTCSWANRYDLIQIVSLEGLGLTAAGARGLIEDHLATVEGLAACLRIVRDSGIIAISRGIQEPPRENIRLLATLAEALELTGIRDAGEHIVQVRDYLGVCTMALRTPLDDERRQRLREAIRELNLTPVWYPGISPEEVNRPDALSGPAGTGVDWLHYAASRILSPERESFYRSWLFNVRPARDDRPFFWDFYKPQAVAELKRAYGELWLTRAELGRLFLYASLAATTVASALLILAPLAAASAWQRYFRRKTSAPALPRGSITAMLGYFASIGVGFMAIEMALISRAIHYLGDPVTASATVIGGVLVVSGLGSLLQTRLVPNRLWVAPGTAAGFALALWQVSSSPTDRVAAPILLTITLMLAAFVMGMALPGGLAKLQRIGAQLVPWAWGINGLASVLATGLSLLVALESGYRTVMLLAAASYLAAAGFARLLQQIETARITAGRGE